MNRPLVILNLIWITGIAYFGVQALYLLAALPPAGGVPPAVADRPPDAAAKGGARPQGYYRIIAERNLFDTRRSAPEGQKPVDLKEMARTGLKLVLRGTVAGDLSPAYAVIEDEKEKTQRLYREGEEVQGAAIRLILREQVILQVNGRDEILAMAKPGDTLAVEPPGVAAAPESDAAPREIALSSEAVSAALGDLYSLAQQATIRPNFSGGMRDGFLLARVQPRSVFSQLGLKTGDVIKTVNGEEVTSVGQALNLYRNLTPGNRVEVLISRQGNDQTLVFAIE